MLQGKRIIVLRAVEQAEEMVQRIERFGGEAICYPVISFRVPSDPNTLLTIQETLDRLSEYDWIIFTSVNGVRYFEWFLHRRGDTLASIITSRMTVVAVGPKTEKALIDRGISALSPPSYYQQEGILQTIQDCLRIGQKILIPSAAITRDVLPDELRNWGMDVTQIAIYENTVGYKEEDRAEHSHLVTAGELLARIQAGTVDVLPFTSSSTVTNFIAALRNHGVDQPQTLLAPIPIVCIGHVTAETARQAGLHVTKVAERATIDCLLQAIASLP